MQIIDGEDFDRKAREIESQILQTLAKRGQVNVAKVLGVSETTVSRFKDGHFEAVSRELASLGLKVVPAEWRMADPETLQAFMKIFNVALNSHEHPHEILLMNKGGPISGAFNSGGGQAGNDATGLQ